jgi:divalent metal cation (Fe/Co/Zn/Cd) transporter
MSDSPDVIRTTLLGLSVNMSLGLLKYITGQRLSCKPLAADGVHSVGDSFVDIGASIVVSSVSSKLLEKFQVSHATFEQIGTLAIGMLVLIGGLSVGCTAIRSLLTTTKRPLGCSAESSFSHMYAVGIALASILSKELLYIYCVYTPTLVYSKNTLNN